MGLLSRIDQITSPYTAADEAVSNDTGEFSKGLRSGYAAAGGQIHALAGGVGEAVGADQFAQDQYAKSAADQQEAARAAPRITSYKDVNGLRDSFDYAAGLAGQSAPMIGTGLAAAALTRGKGLRPMVNATLATAPFEVGGALERQQTDPEALHRSAGERLAVAGGEGLATSALQNFVPVAAEGKLLGHAVAASEGAAERGVGTTLAKNVTTAVAGNAAAGAASEKVHQLAADQLDPNRDTSGDTEALKEAAVGGAVLGAPFGAVGAAGEALHGNKPSSLDIVNKTKNLFSGGSREPVDLDVARKMAAGEEIVSPKDIAGAPPEKAAEILKASDQTAFQKATQWASELVNDATLPPEKREAVAAAAQDLSSKANQAVVAGVKAAKDIGQQAADKVSDLYQTVTSKLSAPDGARSEDNAGIRQKISLALAPELGDTYSSSLPALSDSISRVIEKARADGEVPDVVVGKLQNVLGDQTRTVLMNLHDTLLANDDPKATDNFYKVMTKLADEQAGQKSLTDAVRSSLKPELAKTAAPADIQEAVDHIKDFVGERYTGNMTKAQAELHKRDVYDALQEHFGDKTDSLLKVFTDDAAKNAKKSTIDDRAPMTEAENGSVDAASQYEQPRYYGKGKDGLGLVQDEATHAQTYGNDNSPARDLLAKAQRENPDRNVSFVAAKDLPADHPGLAAHQAAGLPLDGHGIVVAEGMKQEGRLTPDELNSMKLDTSKTSHLDSASRIDTGVKGVTLDAKRIAQTMQGKLEYNGGDDKSGLHRLARTFTEGIAAAQDHLGKTFDVKDETVVARRGGKDITYGELKKLSTRPEDPAWMHGKTDEEINASVRMRENLADSTLAELRQFEPKLHDVLAKRESAFQAEVNSLKSKGVRMTREDFAQMRKTFRVDEARDAIFQLERELENREKGTVAERLADSGRHGTEVAPDANIHDAVAALGEQGVARHADADGNALKYDNRGSIVNDDGTLSKVGRAAVDSALNRLEQGKTAIQRRLGERGRALEAKVDAMTPRDQLEFARITKERDASAVADVINRLTEKYQGVDGKPQRFAERVLAGGKSLDGVLANVSKSEDMAALQKSVAQLLALKNSNEHAVRAIEAINQRMGELVSAHPEAAYNLLKSHQRTGDGDISATDAKAVREHIEKVLGQTVKVELAKMFHAGEFERMNGADVIRISVHSLDPMSVAYHESLHAFFQQLRDTGEHDAAKVLYKAADSGMVKNQLRKLLAGEPEALKQIETSLEERAAYMYQFWAAGKLNLGDSAKGVVGKLADFFRKVLGMWSNDERALHIMQYFHSGEYAKDAADRNAVARTLDEGTSKAVKAAKRMTEPLARLADTVLSSGDARLRDTNNPALVQLADLIHRQTTGQGRDQGFLPASREMRSRYMNNLAESLKDVNAEHLQAALESLQRGVPAANKEGRYAAAVVRKVLDDMYDYMKQAGVNLGDLGHGKDYFPRVWDAEYVSKHQDEFKAMVQRYVDSGEFKGSVPQLIARLTRQDGSEVGVETATPGMEHVKERKLDFIRAQDAAPFLQKDLYQTMNSYITQATRRAEWTRRFKDDGSGLRKLLAEAKDKHGASVEDIRTAEQFVRGVDGTLGDDISPTLRRAFGNMIVYQNIRLLPLAIFSSVIDPLGIAVRGGTMRDAFSAFKRGIKEIPLSYRKDAKGDSAYQLAQDMGVIDNKVLMHTLGSSYSQSMMGNTARKINDTFFRFNMMEQFNTSMRVAATEAAARFLARHADGTASPHSARWLAELGFQPGEVKVKDGQPLLRQHEFESAGMSPEAAAEMQNRMSAAVNKWVDGAVLRPNAAHKPIWMNDPHWALIAHLKQFTYSFHETILKRVAEEVRHGNYSPAAALASYVPVMIAADLMKGMIQGGGQQPDWKEGWDAGDYVWNGVQRAGLLGVGQFGEDVAKNIHEGGTGIGSLAGPTIEQLADAVHVVGGHGQFAPFALKSMPANALYASALGKESSDPTFAE